PYFFFRPAARSGRRLHVAASQAYARPARAVKTSSISVCVAHPTRRSARAPALAKPHARGLLTTERDDEDVAVRRRRRIDRLDRRHSMRDAMVVQESSIERFGEGKTAKRPPIL